MYFLGTDLDLVFGNVQLIWVSKFDILLQRWGSFCTVMTSRDSIQITEGVEFLCIEMVPDFGRAIIILLQKFLLYLHTTNKILQRTLLPRPEYNST